MVEPGSVPERRTASRRREAYGIGMAVGRRDCAESTGCREAAHHQVQLDRFLSMDEEPYASRDDLRAAIEHAQGAIEGWARARSRDRVTFAAPAR